MKPRKPLNPMIAIQNAQLLAIEGVLMSTLDAFERRVRRWFSKEHSTAYVDTFKLPWDELLLHYYESNLTNKSYNDVYDMAVEQYLPEFMTAQEDADEEFAKGLVKEQQATLNRKKAKERKDGIKNDTISVKPDKAVKKGRKQQSIKKKDAQSERPIPKTMSLKFEEDPEEL